MLKPVLIFAFLILYGNKETKMELDAVIHETETIEVFGARVHNLKNIDISIPKNKLVVITGISGSGKSSLAFDTIYAKASAVIWKHLAPMPAIYRRYGKT